MLSKIIAYLYYIAITLKKQGVFNAISHKKILWLRYLNNFCLNTTIYHYWGKSHIPVVI